MPSDPWSFALLTLFVCIAAAVYASVGHGGASAYLAAMALFGVPASVMTPLALAMNVTVATLATWRFARADLVPWRQLLPLCVASTPAAYLGGLMRLPETPHRFLLGVVLVLAALRLWWRASEPTQVASPHPWVLCVTGVVLGLLAGLTGIGGGIFLSPLMILSGWQDVRRTAGASAFFILVNSTAGLLGQFHAAASLPREAPLLCAVVALGGLYGSWMGARRLPPLALRRLLALVLVLAGLRLLLGH